MRLRELALLKYGVFADHVFDFGDGKVDLHLIVGPNEAGKSTLLSGLSDLLFGIPERTAYGFRHGMSELAIGATLEHGGDRIDIVRRKKRKDPLTTPEGEPLAEARLSPFLGGTDRDAFAKMFGLNQARLREGGDSFLGGAQNAARAVLEAEAGLTGLGVLLADLDGQADGLFAPTARTKPLNLKFAERKDAEQRAREQAVDERQWAALNARQAAAEATRRNLIARLAEIAGRSVTLERIRRVRPFLATLDSRLHDLAPLAALPHLPLDAEVRRAGAERLITAGEARLQALEEALTRKQTAPGEELDASLLEAGEHIERLVAHRGVYDDRRRALPRRTEDLAALSAGITKVKVDGGLDAVSEPPPKVARDRLRQAVQAVRDGRAALERLDETLRRQRQDLEEETRRLGEIGAVGDLAGLRDRLEQAPRDVTRQRAAAKRAVEAAEHKLALELTGLAPWTGEITALAATAAPSEPVIEAARTTFARLDGERVELRRAVADAETRLTDVRAELAKLSGDGAALPTQAVLTAARKVRDAAWGRLRDVVAIPGKEPADPVADTNAYEDLVRQADDLADRRQTEADRLASHLLHSAELDRLTNRAAAANEGLTRLAGDVADATVAWTAHCARVGFDEPITPAEMSVWAAARLKVLEAHQVLSQLRTETAAVAAQTDRQLLSLRHMLIAIAPSISPDEDPDALIAQATGLVRRLEEQQLERTRVEEVATRLTGEARRSPEALATEKTRSELRLRALTDALIGCGLQPSSDDVAVAAALDGFDQWASALGAYEQMQERVRLIQADIDDVEAEVAELLGRLGRAGGDDLGQTLLELGGELRTAKAAQTKMEHAAVEAEALSEEAENLRASLGVAKADLAELAAAAGVAEPSALAEVIAKARSRDELQADVERLHLEIDKAGDGLSLEILGAEVISIAPEELASELAILAAEQRDLAEERDAISAELSDAIRDVAVHASGSGAAAALQEAEDARAEASVQAERYMEARSVAALLRWAIARHRKTRAAPLLARASAIMATVTQGAFLGLELDFELEDEPIVVGLRSSGERLPSSAMSEGTRDQLYLALRLAAVEERAVRHAMPFIADDLLVNGDDDRCAAIFGALGQLAETSQVLCFTHHEHLVPIAERALGAGGIRLHRLGKRPATAMAG